MSSGKDMAKLAEAIIVDIDGKGLAGALYDKAKGLEEAGDFVAYVELAGSALDAFSARTR